jgi:dephospho-CoA kinase
LANLRCLEFISKQEADFAMIRYFFTSLISALLLFTTAHCGGIQKVAITGGLSCGNSTVCQIFQDLGLETVSADLIVHDLLNNAPRTYRAVVDLLGEAIVVDGHLDKSLIGAIVFSSPKDLQALEKILYPLVHESIEKAYQKASRDPSINLFVAEAPLLFEGGTEALYEKIIAVVADEEYTRERFIHKTGKDKNEYERRMSMQLSPEEKASRANFVIINNGNLKDLQKQVEETMNSI